MEYTYALPVHQVGRLHRIYMRVRAHEKVTRMGRGMHEEQSVAHTMLLHGSVEITFNF